MNLTLIKQHNQAALLRVLATLFVMVGLAGGAAVATLPRHLRLKVLRLLRPLESSVRRLLFAEAQGIEVEPRPSRNTSDSKKKKPRRKGTPKPSFALVEPLQRTGPPAPNYAKGFGPNISGFDEFDQRPVLPPEPSPEDAMDAGALCRRLQALSDVLNNMQKYAERLARWQARRDAAPARSGRTRPLRPGRPPGHRARAVHEIDEILRECHKMALMAQAAPDTS